MLMTNFKLGTSQFRIGNEIDGDAPGHYARVFSGDVLIPSGVATDAAIKVMKSEHTRQEGGDKKRVYYDVFVREAKILAKLKASGSPGFTELLGCGYLTPSDKVMDYTKRNRLPASICLSREQPGEMYDPESEMTKFEEGVSEAFKLNRLPFLVLKLVEKRERNLLHIMRRNDSPFLLPITDALNLFSKLAIWLEHTHAQQIAYIDFKLEHFYWDGNELQVIDWNTSDWIDSENGSDAAKDMIRRDIHDCIAGVLYPILTGRKATDQNRNFSPQPGPVEQVRTRYQNVHQASFEQVDERLGRGFKSVLQYGLEGKIGTDAVLQKFVQECKQEWGGGMEGNRGRAFNQMVLAIDSARAAHRSLLEANERLNLAKASWTGDPFFKAEADRLINEVDQMRRWRFIP